MSPTYDYSLLTEGVIVFTWAVPAWYMYITFRESKRSQRSAWIAFSISLLWAALAWYLAKGDISWGDSPIFQARPLIVMGVSVGLTAIFAQGIIGPGLDQRWLIGLQLFRPKGHRVPNRPHPPLSDLLCGLHARFESCRAAQIASLPKKPSWLVRRV